MLANVEQCPNGIYTVIPAELSTDASEALCRSSIAHAMEDLQGIFDVYLRNLDSSVTMDEYVTWDKQQIDNTFVAALRSGRWVTQSLNLRPDLAENMLSVFCFLSPDKSNAQFKKRLTEQNTLVVNGNDNSKSNNKTLFIGGRCSQLIHAHQAVANILGFLASLCPAAKNSMLFKKLSMLDTILRSPNGRQWKEYWDKPQVVVAILNLIQDIWAPFAGLADHAEYRRAVEQNTAIPAVHYLTAMQTAECMLIKFRTDVNSNNGRDYDLHSPLSQVLPQTIAEPAPTSKREPDPSRESPSDREHKKQKQKTSPTTTPGKSQGKIDNQKEFGWLQWKGKPDKVPACSVIYGADQKRVCTYFITKELFCRFADKCNMHHLPTFADLPQDEKPKMKTWVSKEKKVDWLDGKTPPSE